MTVVILLLLISTLIICHGFCPGSSVACVRPPLFRSASSIALASRGNSLGVTFSYIRHRLAASMAVDAGTSVADSIGFRYHYELTILIPAFNEKDRIGDTLLKYINYLSNHSVYQSSSSVQEVENVARKSSGVASILVVDDGSNDGTADYLMGKSYLKDLPDENNQNDCCWQVEKDVQFITLSQNEGKGAAIEKGMQYIPYSDLTHGLGVITRDIVLVADADGSGDISCLDSMIRQLESLFEISNGSTSDAIVVGYRESKEKSFLRSLLSWGFRTAVSTIFFGSLGVHDTQCGFKLMTLSTGKALYKSLNLRRWTHDVEVIHRAQLMGIPVGECKVPWVDAEGSKLVTSKRAAVTVSIKMLTEISFMRIKYATGEWNVNKLLAHL